MRGVTSQGSSAPYANNPSDPTIRLGTNPTRSLGAPARWAERRQAQPLSPWAVRAWERLGADTTVRATAPRNVATTARILSLRQIVNGKLRERRLTEHKLRLN